MPDDDNKAAADRYRRANSNKQGATDRGIIS